MNYESFNPGEYVAQMDFNGTTGLAAMNGPYMLRSTDSGFTWDTIPTGLSVKWKINLCGICRCSKLLRRLR